MKQPNWKASLWGSNYDRLLNINQKFDPNHLFYVTPGIGADKLLVDASRLCLDLAPDRSTADISVVSTDHPENTTVNILPLPPKGDNHNVAKSASFVHFATP
jgi:hypothetical protein